MRPAGGGAAVASEFKDLKEYESKDGVPLPLPLQNISDIYLDGLKFIILNTAPASFHDFPFLIGLKEKENQLSRN